MSAEFHVKSGVVQNMVRIAWLVFFIFVLFTITEGCSRETNLRKGKVSTHVDFSGELVLEEYATTVFGNHSQMVLTWRVGYKRPRESYSVFVHAIDKVGNILFQFDHKLVNAVGAPTNKWYQESVKDVFQLTPPQGHDPGKCALRIGLYVMRGDRMLEIYATALPMPTDEWKGKAIVIRDINCR